MYWLFRQSTPEATFALGSSTTSTVAGLFGFGAVSSLPIVAAGGAATVAGLVAASTQGAAGYGVFRLRRWGLYLALIISALSLLGGILLFSVPIPESMPLALTDEEVTVAAALNILQGGVVGAYLLYRRGYFTGG
jgi:hypothetical protein